MEIHSPDIVGPLAAAGAPGTVGQRLTSAGAGVQVGWASAIVSDTWVNNTLGVTVDGVAATPLVMGLVSADAGNLASAGSDGRVYVNTALIAQVFPFTSASNTTHTIVHNLNNQFPTVTVFDSVTLAQVIPSTVVGTDANTLTITFFTATAIAGTVVG